MADSADNPEPAPAGGSEEPSSSPPAEPSSSDSPVQGSFDPNPETAHGPAIYRNKERGNELFAQGDLAGAVEHWTASVKSLNYILSQASLEVGQEATEEALAEFVRMYVALCLNLSLAYLKLEDYGKCKEYCSYALIRDERSIKAHLRIVQADIKLRNFDKALSNCERGLKHNPNDPELLSLKRLIREQLRKHRELDRVFAKRVFDSIEPDPRAHYDPLDDLMKSRYYRFSYRLTLCLLSVYRVLKRLCCYAGRALGVVGALFDRASVFLLDLGSSLSSRFNRVRAAS